MLRIFNAFGHIGFTVIFWAKYSIERILIAISRTVLRLIRPVLQRVVTIKPKGTYGQITVEIIYALLFISYLLHRKTYLFNDTCSIAMQVEYVLVLFRYREKFERRNGCANCTTLKQANVKGTTKFLTSRRSGLRSAPLFQCPVNNFSNKFLEEKSPGQLLV